MLASKKQILAANRRLRHHPVKAFFQKEKASIITEKMSYKTDIFILHEVIIFFCFSPANFSNSFFNFSKKTIKSNCKKTENIKRSFLGKKCRLAGKTTATRRAGSASGKAMFFLFHYH